MATRYYCDGCDTQFAVEDTSTIFGSNAKAPKVPLMVYESESKEQRPFCGWACLAAYAARHATTGVDWDALTENTEEAG